MVTLTSEKSKRNFSSQLQNFLIALEYEWKGQEGEVLERNKRKGRK